MGKHGKGGGGSAHDRAVQKAAEGASRSGTPVISDEPQTDSQARNSKQNSGRFHNRSDSISIVAIMIALLLWALYPTVLTRLFCLAGAAIAAANLGYKSEWVRLWPSSAKHSCALLSVLLVLFMGGSPVLTQWREEHLLASAISFRAIAVGIGNMPERKKLAETWDGKPWDEDHYEDVRLSIDNNLALPLEQLDLSVSVTEGDKDMRIAAIGEVNDVSGVQFRAPQGVPHGQLPPLRLHGADGKDYNLPVEDIASKMHLPAPSYQMFCPRLEPKDTLHLIMGVSGTTVSKKSPSRLRITGTYHAESISGNVVGRIDEVVAVTQ